MERPPKYVMILFPPCDLSLTPHMHGEEVSFHCLFFVRVHRIWTALPSTQLLHSQCICALCNAITLPQDGAFAQKYLSHVCFVMIERSVLHSI